MQDTPEFAQMQTFLFPFLASLLFIAMHIVIYFLLVRRISSRRALCRIYSIILWVNMCFCVVYMFMRSYIVAPKWLFMIVSVSVGVAFSFLIAALIAALIGICLWFFKKKHLQPRIKRYILFLCFIYTAYAIYHGLEDPKVERLAIELPKLSKPLKVIQLSDIHIGGLIDDERVAKIVFLVNQENPDIIAITGDLVDTKLQNALSSLHILQGLRATYGTYYVLGNHEYIHDVDDILKAIQKTGIKVLINESITLPNLINIAGSADLMGSRVKFLEPDFEATFSKIDSSLPTLFLTHQPKVIEIIDPKLLQKADFLLTGHTHSGQIFPFSLAVLFQQPYLKGLHRISSGAYIYVSEGAGFWGPPMRAFSDSTITLFDFLPQHTKPN